MSDYEGILPFRAQRPTCINNKLIRVFHLWVSNDSGRVTVSASTGSACPWSVRTPSCLIESSATLRRTGFDVKILSGILRGSFA